MDKQRFINEVNTRCEFNKYNHIFATDIEPELAVVEAELRPESLNPLGMARRLCVFNVRYRRRSRCFSVCRKIRNAQRQSVFHAPGQGQKAPLRSANNKARPHRQRR